MHHFTIVQGLDQLQVGDVHMYLVHDMQTLYRSYLFRNRLVK